MSFLETPRFPEKVSLEMVGGRRYRVDVSETTSGAETRIERWNQPKNKLRISHKALVEALHQELLDHFDAVGGNASGFRVKNWFDYKLTVSTAGLVGLHGTVQVGGYAIGHGVPAYQIRRRRTRGALTRTMDIRKPVSTGLVIYRGGSAVTVGVSAGNISIDTTTGIVTFVADATRTVTTVTVGATTQIVVSGSALSQVGIGDRLYLTGLAGADAALLNNLSHLVTNLSSTTYTLSTNTAGKTITAGSGVASAFPQVDESLTVAGEFDMPMRFLSDEIEYEIVEKNPTTGFWFAWLGVELVEILV